MADMWSPERRSEVMGKIRGRGNKSTELALARLFRLNRIRGWRRHLPLPGRPDFCFPGPRVAIFVDGCFWHGCPRCFVRPRTNVSFWDGKIRGNKARDRKVGRELRARGYRVLRVYEHELRRPSAVLARIRRLLAGVG